ncbi:MAG: hypothetical protein HQL60_05335 [Magnetococcales bacterium]|nr:hypothetical protein [Magnetococcales bacterium]
MSVTALDLAAVDDTGISTSDNLTAQTGGLTLSGNGQVNANVTLFDDKDNDGVIDSGEALATVAVNGNGNWMVDCALAAGAHAIKAISTDVDGNSSAASAALMLTVDTSAPAAPTGLDLAAEDESVFDNITLQTSDLTISGSGETGARVTLFEDQDNDNIIDAGELRGTAVVSGGVWSTDIDLVTSGTHAIKAIQTDAAGNPSAVSAVLVIGTLLNSTTDDTAVAAPAGLSLLAADDSGLVGDGVTNKTTVTVTGAGEVGAKVTLFDGSSQKGTATVGAAGNWSIRVSGLSQGLHALTATQLVSGVSSAASDGLLVSIDTTAPPVATGLDLADEADLGFLTTDNITAATGDLTISGKGEAGATVTLFADKNKNGRWDSGEFKAASAVVVDDEGNWSGVFETLTGGTHSIVAVQTDLAGNVGKASTALSVVVDPTPPAAPTKLDLVAADDTGASSSDNVTGVTENLTITGVGEKGLQVMLFTETEGELGEALATTTVTSKGTWSADIAALQLGDHVIRAKQMDLAGNLGPASAPLNLKVIEILPTDPPPAPTLLAADDTGIATMPDTLSDGVTSKNKALTITGAGAIANTKVTLFEEGVTKAIGTATATAAGAWSVKIASLANGAHTFKATQVGDGGVSAKSEGLLVSVDSSVPGAPAGLQVNELIGASQTLATGVGVAITGSGDNGAVVTVFNDLNKNSKLDTGELLPTAEPVVVVDGTWRADGINLSGGTNSVRAFQTSLAGHVGKVSTAALTVIVTTPGGFDLATDDDSGVSKSDNITSKGEGLTLSGTATNGATRVNIFIDGEEVASAPVSKGLWRMTDFSLTSGSYSITATQTTNDGDSEPSIPFLLVVDQERPEVAPTELAVAGATRLEDDSFITNKTAGLVISGAGSEPGAGIILLENNKSIGTGVADSAGAWSVTLTKISNGRHELLAQQTDIAGNAGPVSSEALVFTVDGVVPAAPTKLFYSSSTNIVSGRGEAGASLVLFNDVNNNSRVDTGEQIGATITVGESGSWSSVAITDALPAGRYTGIRAIQTDWAGNVSKASGALSVTLTAASLTRALQSYIHPLPPAPISHSSLSLLVGEGKVGGAIDDRMTLLTG